MNITQDIMALNLKENPGCQKLAHDGVIHQIQSNPVTRVLLHGVSIVALTMDNMERLCLAQISNTLLKDYSYNEIHNRRVALGITCVQCTPVQLEILRRAGAMPASSRRCGMITRREAERLVKSFLEDNTPPQLPDDFAFAVKHECGWGCHGQFLPSRYNSSRAKCIKCTYCNMFFSPNKFIFHYHRTSESLYKHPDAANFNSWRRHLNLSDPDASDELQHAWEDVKAMFNGGIRKRVIGQNSNHHSSSRTHGSLASYKNTSITYGHGAASHIPEKKLKLEKVTSYGLTSPTPKRLKDRYSFKHEHRQELHSLKLDPCHKYPRDVFKIFEDHMQLWPPCPENIYTPPYEMIWAQHLGLTKPESNYAFVQNQPVKKDPSYPVVNPCCNRIEMFASPRKDIAPMVITDRRQNEKMSPPPSSFKLYRPYENLIDKPRVSAFKPVITGHCQALSSPIDFSMNKQVIKGQSIPDNDQQASELYDHSECTKESPSTSKVENTQDAINEEVLDVDTIEDQHEQDKLTELEQNSEINPKPLEENVMKCQTPKGNTFVNGTCTLKAAIDKLLVEVKQSIRRIYLFVDNNNGRCSSDSVISDNRNNSVTKSGSGDEENCLVDLNDSKVSAEPHNNRNRNETDYREQVESELKEREEIEKQLQLFKDKLLSEFEEERKETLYVQEQITEVYREIDEFTCKMKSRKQCPRCRGNDF